MQTPGICFGCTSCALLQGQADPDETVLGSVRGSGSDTRAMSDLSYVGGGWNALECACMIGKRHTSQ